MEVLKFKSYSVHCFASLSISKYNVQIYIVRNSYYPQAASVRLVCADSKVSEEADFFIYPPMQAGRYYCYLPRLQYKKGSR